MTRTLTIQYTCAKCHLEDRKVIVPERKPEQDVVDWLTNVATPHLVRDHEKMSPGCRPKEFAEVKIPIGPTGSEVPVGMAPESQPED